ncbi:MAG TPA: alpha/beta hydrolase-fold protein [Chryseosolibacter sp.]
MQWLTGKVLAIQGIILSFVFSAAAQDADKRAIHTTTGDIRTIDNFKSSYLQNDRTITVYLPPGYAASTDQRYPVIYMHDNQNLFDGARAYVAGSEWKADETAQELMSKGVIGPAIIVGIDHANEQRVTELTPTKTKRGGGQASNYAAMLIKEIKPMIDSIYRTKVDRKNTMVCGSSLGGIMSLYLGLNHPETFGAIGVMSPSLWWDNGYFLKAIEASNIPADVRFWVDCGSEEGSKMVNDVKKLKALFEKKGLSEGEHFRCTIYEGAEHNEESWSRRFGDVLDFFL